MDTNEKILAQLREMSAQLDALGKANRRTAGVLNRVEQYLEATNTLEETVVPVGMTVAQELIDVIHDQTPTGNVFVLRCGQIGIEIPAEVYRWLVEQVAR